MTQGHVVVSLNLFIIAKGMQVLRSNVKTELDSQKDINISKP